VLAHANGGRLVGTIAVSDEPKPEAAQTVSTLQRLGKEVRRREARARRVWKILHDRIVISCARIHLGREITY
jgi:hypothetical protein